MSRTNTYDIATALCQIADRLKQSKIVILSDSLASISIYLYGESAPSEYKSLSIALRTDKPILSAYQTVYASTKVEGVEVRLVMQASNVLKKRTVTKPVEEYYLDEELIRHEDE